MTEYMSVMLLPWFFITLSLAAGLTFIKTERLLERSVLPCPEQFDSQRRVEQARSVNHVLTAGALLSVSLPAALYVVVGVV
jgi:hypothetical protein